MLVRAAPLGSRVHGPSFRRHDRPLGAARLLVRRPPPFGLPQRRRRGDRRRPDRAEHRRAAADPGHVRVALGAQRRRLSRGRLRDHAGGHPPLRPAQHPRAPPHGARHARGTHQLEHVGRREPRLQQSLRHEAPGDDRRPHRLHRPLLGRVLGRPGRRDRGHRAHRGRARAWRVRVGRQRGQRRRQHHHQVRGGHAGGLRFRDRGDGGARHRGGAARRSLRRRPALARLRQVERARLLGRAHGRRRGRPLALRPRRLPHGLVRRRGRRLHAPGRRLRGARARDLPPLHHDRALRHHLQGHGREGGRQRARALDARPRGRLGAQAPGLRRHQSLREHGVRGRADHDRPRLPARHGGRRRASGHVGPRLSLHRLLVRRRQLDRRATQRPRRPPVQRLPPGRDRPGRGVVGHLRVEARAQRVHRLRGRADGAPPVVAR